MTKKDYQALARAIYSLSVNTADAGITTGITYMGASWIERDALVKEVAGILAADSPRFNRALFLEACETGGCKGMPKRAPSTPTARVTYREGCTGDISCPVHGGTAHIG